VKVQKWYWLNGEIIGYLDEKGIEVKLTPELLEDREIHDEFHNEIRREHGSDNERVQLDSGE
jgi:hypothetical protein